MSSTTIGAIPDLHESANTQFIEAGGTKYAYRIFGAETGIPLVFLHHFTATIDDWDPRVTNGLAQHFKVVLLDNKGIGASDGQTPDNVKGMADDATAAIRALGFTKVNLLGFSLGGFVAQQIALDSPGLVNKLILAATGPKGGEGISNLPNIMNQAFSTAPEDPRLFLFYSKSPESIALGRESLARVKKRKVNRVPATGMPSIQAQVKSILGWAADGKNVYDELGRIKHPSLVVNGNNDIMFPTINSYNLFQHLPNAKLSLYSDSGHGAIYQYADRFVEEAVDFLKAD
ncbi:MAG: alpha/beta hydrolase [Bacteroidetes bacterium]|nr:alpha/beta hydrolase [Bacteroidota bacterium]